ncbi:MAG: PAS domain S-box protein [Ignavibacteriales bacterium]|nr:PAS domain S-box protein [Ignavibacteriales bacterium]
MSIPLTTPNILEFTPPRTDQPQIVFKRQTKHVRTAETYWSSDKLFESVWKNSIDGMTLTDDEGNFVKVNQSFCNIVGLSENQLLGQPFAIVWHNGFDEKRLFQAYKRRFSTNQLKPLVERRLILWSGEVKDLKISGSFVDSGDGKKLLLTIVRDLTFRKKTENDLKKSEKGYRDLFDNAPQGMFQSSPEGKLINANRALLRLLGYDSREELAGMNLGDLYINPDDRKVLGKALEIKGYCNNIELKLRRKDGKTITVLEHSRAIKDDTGNVSMYEGILEDITTRKALEDQIRHNMETLKASEETLKSLNAQKDKLFSILSHDLRSPFTSILGFCDILINEGEQLQPEERKEFMNYIKASAQQQLALVNKLLDWSRLETDRVQLDIKEIDLYGAVQSSIIALTGTAKQKEIDLVSNLPTNMNIRGDAQLLQQIFTNLIGNSLKFTPRRGKIAIELAKESKDFWVINVSDTGVGIPASDMPKIFKAEEMYTRPGIEGEQGTGLGLPICYEIVQKHGGNIEVASQEGKGTTFRVTFPKLVQEDGVKVLIADDEQGVRVMHARHLRRVLPKATIMQASDGKEAYELARNYQPHVIISDYGMPFMDGCEFLNLLKQDPATKEIPVFIVTGVDSFASKEMLKQKGAIEVLAKPLSPDQFKDLLQRSLPQQFVQ